MTDSDNEMPRVFCFGDGNRYGVCVYDDVQEEYRKICECDCLYDAERIRDALIAAGGD